MAFNEDAEDISAPMVISPTGEHESVEVGLFEFHGCGPLSDGKSVERIFGGAA